MTGIYGIARLSRTFEHSLEHTMFYCGAARYLVHVFMSCQLLYPLHHRAACRISDPICAVMLSYTPVLHFLVVETECVLYVVCERCFPFNDSTL